MKTDPRAMVNQIDQTPAPDLWRDIQGRRPGPPPPEPAHRGRLAAGLVAAVVSIAAIGFLVYAFSSSSENTAVTNQDQRVDGEIPALSATYRYPPTWHIQPFEEQVGHAGFTGAVVSNVEGELHHPDLGPNEATTAWDLSDLPPDGVVISIEHVEAGPFDGSEPDSSFPVSLSDAQALGKTEYSGDTEGLWIEFTLDGELMGARVYFGPNASQEDRRVAADVVASIRPQQTPAAVATPPCPVTDSIHIAGDGRTFDTDCLAILERRKTPFEFRLDGRAAPQNFVICDSEKCRHSDGIIVGTEIVLGPEVMTGVVPALEAGTYYFVDQAHPQLAYGTLYVVAANRSPHQDRPTVDINSSTQDILGIQFQIAELEAEDPTAMDEPLTVLP